MTSQGLFGALEQYWNVQPKPRLERRNTFFDDSQVSNVTALRVGIVASTVAMTAILFFGIVGCFV